MGAFGPSHGTRAPTPTDFASSDTAKRASVTHSSGSGRRCWREQTAGIEQVGIAVTQMDEVTQQNAALVEEASAAAHALAEPAGALREAVAAFRLRDHAARELRDNRAITARLIVSPPG